MINAKLIGQSSLLDRLNGIISGGRIAHAYLLKGPKGIGKTTIGKKFAKMILCSSKAKRPCNICQSCIQFDTANHPDYKYVEPMGQSIRIDQIRELRQDIAIKPYQGRYKIYLIDDSHIMTQQAQNALLKTLEEPPSFVVIILCTDNIHALLPTITSRCQSIPIRHLASRYIVEILKKRNIDEDKARVYAQISAGIAGRAIDISMDEEFKTLREKTLDYIGDLFSKPDVQILKDIDLFISNRENIWTIMELLALFMRDVLVYSETLDNHLIINTDKLSEIYRYSEEISREQIKGAIESIKAAQRMLKSNANFQLTIENMLLSISGGVKLCI